MSQNKCKLHYRVVNYINKMDANNYKYFHKYLILEFERFYKDKNNKLTSIEEEEIFDLIDKIKKYRTFEQVINISIALQEKLHYTSIFRLLDTILP